MGPFYPLPALLPWRHSNAKKGLPNKSAGSAGVSLLGERNLWQMLVLAWKVQVEEGEENNRVVQSFSWAILKTGVPTYAPVSLWAPQACPEPSSNHPGLYQHALGHIQICCQQHGSVNRMLAGDKMHSAFSLCKDCSFREQQSAHRSPWRTQQNRYDNREIGGCNSETTVSFFNLPFMAYWGKAKSLPRT